MDSQHPCSRHPGFHFYRRLRDEFLGIPTADWVARCNFLAAQRDLRSAAGVPIRFVLGRESGGALGYEGAILHQGSITCRPGGRGAVHDLHNALVWLTFPRIKAVLNRLHLDGPGSCASNCADSRTSGRGPHRDAITLLDESGMLWLSNAPLLDAQLRARDWRGLMVTNRDLVREQVLPIIVGHGLLEKLGSPYKAMTAHCLVVSVRWVVADAADADRIDAQVAEHISASFAAGRPPVLAPLPILGLPGWDRANDDPSYYEDARVFRVPHVPSA